MGLTADERIMYYQTRVTYWLSHQVFKGTTCSADFTGNLTGDALDIRFVEFFIGFYYHSESLSLLYLKTIDFDKKADGGEFHKYQHPIMVCEKRFANGAAGVTGIFCLGQLLNLAHDSKVIIGLILGLDD